MHEVTFTVQFRAKVEAGESLADAVSDIDIPENAQCKYVPDSFEVESVKDAQGNEVDDWDEEGDD